MKYILTILAACLTLSTSFSMAEETVKKARWYQINMTFFQQKHDRSLDESFEYNPVELTMGDVIKLHNEGDTFLLAESGMNVSLALHHENANTKPYTLQTINDDWAKVLQKLDPVKQSILYNAQWVQPVYDQQHSLPIYFESSQTQLNKPQLKGLFHLHVSRYLHSGIDLQYVPEDASSLNETISLHQSRRMRSKEVHYIDHPNIGVLIRILPTEHPLDILEEAPTETEATPIESALNARI